jgi:peptide/nickel transport system permease protein
VVIRVEKDRAVLFAYVLRRLGAMALILLGSTFLIYNLTAVSGDPVADLRFGTEVDSQAILEEAIRSLQLDVPPPVRYFFWLQGILGVFTGEFTLGVGRDGAAVLDVIALAIPISFRLVITATILSIVIGISIGIASALRQYSRFDYSVTFVAFLFYSLPIFWIAVLLKAFGAIGFNDFLYDPKISATWLIGLSLVSAVFWAGVMGTTKKLAAMTFLVSGLTTFAVLAYISETGWLLNPSLGPVVIGITSLAIAVFVTQISNGLENRRALAIATVVAVLVLVAYFLVQPMFTTEFDGSLMLPMAAGSVLVPVAIGLMFGGDDRKQIARTAAIVGFLGSGLIVLDRFMQSWNDYYNNDWIFGRPISTFGEATTDLNGDYWITGIDAFTHLLLPTIALMLVSLASYVRYSRASLLEVLNQDYIRTARAKGLTERAVIMRHGFRNALIPLTTIMAFDFAGVLGGAIITEQVFAWRGMGTLFNQALARVDLNAVMGVVLVTSVSAITFNLIADLIYSALDPRIRTTK